VSVEPVIAASVVAAVQEPIEVQVRSQEIQERIAAAQARAQERTREAQERMQERMKDAQEKMKDKGLFKYDFDFDFGSGSKFPRVSPAALADPNALLDPGPGDAFNLELGGEYKPTNGLTMSLNYSKNRLTRNDTHLLAFTDNIYSFRSTYQFSRFVFTRARIDYDTLGSNARAQFLFGYTPNPGTAFYVGYNDDLTRNGFNPFTGQLEPGFRRNGRTFFIKMSYLFRKSFGG